MVRRKNKNLTQHRRGHLDFLAGQTHGAVVGLVAHLAQVAAYVKELLRVGVEVVQHGRLADVELEILENQSNQPVRLQPPAWRAGSADAKLGHKRWQSKSLAETKRAVKGSGSREVENAGLWYVPPELDPHRTE